MAFNRIDDPAQVAVQLNIKIPWGFREFLRSKATDGGVSLNHMVNEALDDRYGAEYRRSLKEEGE